MPERRPPNDIEHRHGELIGLQGRLFLGTRALDPNLEIPTDQDPQWGNFEARNYTVFQTASTHERREYWDGQGIPHSEREQVWTNQVTAIFQQKNFSDEEKRFFGQGGAQIDVDNFLPETARTLYQRYFADQDVNGVKLFVQDIITRILPREGRPQTVEIERHLPVISWFSRMFGQKSADIMAQLTMAEARHQENPNFFDENIDRLNMLTQEEEDLLTFLWQYRPEIDDDELTPSEIADRLVDYETGEVLDNEVNLRPTFEALAIQAQQMILSEDPRVSQGKPTIILSDVAEAMIDRIAQRANDINGELAFFIKGIWMQDQRRTPHFIGAYAVPASDFLQTHEREVAVSQDATYIERSEKLAQVTNLDTFFTDTIRSAAGQDGPLVHTHLSPRGRGNINPSDQDIETMEERAMANVRRTKSIPQVLGIIAKTHGEVKSKYILFNPTRQGVNRIDLSQPLVESEILEETPLDDAA